jgi:hypothetical protein
MAVNHRVLALFLASFLLLGLPMGALASEHEPDPPIGWDMGIVVEEDMPSEFNINKAGVVSLQFWVRNDNLVPISVDIEYVLPFDATVTGTESVEVSASTNESFDFTLRGIDVRGFDAGKRDTVEVEARLTAYGPIPSTGAEMRTDEVDLIIPHIIELSVDLAEPAGPMNAGTTTFLTATVTNDGNDNDSVFRVTMTDTCPLLEVSGGDALEDIIIGRNQSISAELNLTSSASHPDKTCIVEISIQSQGDMDDGIAAAADDDESSLRVVKEPLDDGGSSGGSGGGGSNGDNEVVSSNWAPLPAWVAIIGLLGAAISRRRE